MASLHGNQCPKDAASALGGIALWKQLGPEVQWHRFLDTFFPGKVALADGNFLLVEGGIGL